ncbi:MAG TPA: ABC transporter ATP-binding protein [Acidimicrobiia bacterium]|nr:ABC transporter ATP-binding protein [Acidimicrobiia bacterium]
MLLRLIRTHVRPYRWPITIIVVLQFASTLAALYLPSLNADIIDNGVARGDTGYILRVGGWMLLVSLVQAATSIGALYFGSRTAMAVGRDLRAGLFDRVARFSSQEVNHFGAPSLLTRTTNDIQQIQMLLSMGFAMLVMAPMMAIGGIVMALREDTGLAWLLLVAIPVLALVVLLIVSRMVPGFRVMQEKIDRINQILREQITGIRVVRAFVREPYETRRFGEANDDLTRVAVFTGRWMATMFPTVMLVFNLSMVAVLWFGGLRVADGAMQVGSLTAFIAYLAQILMSVMMATFVLSMVPRASVSANRITEVLETESSVVLPLEPVRAAEERGEVRFDHVTFAYPGAEAPVLSDLDFVATPGRTTAIIGATGSGKSTLVGLIPRLYDVTDGRVLVDGVDVRDMSAEDLWPRIGIVPQRAYLFSGTVRSNLQFGNPDATEDDMWHALEVAQAAGFVRAMPDGLDSPIAQGGTNVSGGQRQRLAIARAIIKRPSIYVFDDSFSALDVSTDARLRQALSEETGDATVIVVAQRVSTIMDADQIIVLEDGAIVGRGTHDELLETSGTYQEIVWSQLGTGEGAA